MSVPTLPTVDPNATLEELRNQVAILQKTITFYLTSNLSSDNAYEFGGWLIGADSLKSEDGTVGMSSTITGGDDVRFWAGNIAPSIAPYRVTKSGAVYASNITITGGSITWAAVNPPTTTDVGALPVNSPKLTNLSAIGDYLGALAQGQVIGLPGKMTFIGPSGIYSGVIGTHQLIADYALITDAMIGTLTANKITAGTLNAVDINGTHITGTSTITGATIATKEDLNVGQNIIFGYGGTNYPVISLIPGQVSISVDSGGKSMTLSALGGVYSGSNRLDGNIVAKFG